MVVQFGSLLVDIVLFGGIVGEGCAVKYFFRAKLRWVGGKLFFDLLVAAANNLVVDGKACAAQFGQDASSQFAETFAHVTDLAFALFGILVHREYAQDNILVLEVRSLYQLLEAIPVLCCVTSLDSSFHLVLLELSLNIAFTRGLTFCSQLIVDNETAFGRCVGVNFHVAQVQFFAVGVDFLQHLHEFGHRIVLQFSFAQVSLVDKELDVSLLLLRLYTLEAVGSDAKSVVGHSLAIELRCGYHAVRNLNGRQIHLFLSHSSIESEVEIALNHVWDIIKVGFHGIASAQFVGHLLSVCRGFFALEGSAFAGCHLTTRVT